MSHFPLLVTVTVALAYALAGGLAARALRLPTIVGYMVAGVALGPFTPGFSGDPESINQLAELGVILLMFGVGLHFSFRDLWSVRRVVFPSAIVQMAAIAAIGYALGRHWQWPAAAGWLLGIAASVASTVVLLRGLEDAGVLESGPGRVATGWSVFEDLTTVALLVLLPALVGGTTGPGVVLAMGKVAAFLALMWLAGGRVIPAALSLIAHTRSRELFVLVALIVGAGAAVGSAMVFGVSLALGAFVAGVVVGESPFSHQIGADLLPFKEAFSVLFFVSVGMLVNPGYLAAHWGQVLALSGVVVIGKAVIAIAAGFIWPSTIRTLLILAAGRSQIGEFSFIVGQTGLSLGLLTEAQYSLILAGAIVSITANPFMFRLTGPAERWLSQRPRLRLALDRRAAEPAVDPQSLANHVVIVGSGRVGRHIAEITGRLAIPRLVVEADPDRADKLRDLGVPILYGDAANSEILGHTALARARALIVTVPDDAAAIAIAAAAREQSPDVPITARASTWEGARRLAATGVTDVVRPELEGGIAIVRRALHKLAIADSQIEQEIERLRLQETQ